MALKYTNGIKFLGLSDIVGLTLDLKITHTRSFAPDATLQVFPKAQEVQHSALSVPAHDALANQNVVAH